MHFYVFHADVGVFGDFIIALKEGLEVFNGGGKGDAVGVVELKRLLAGDEEEEGGALEGDVADLVMEGGVDEVEDATEVHF